MSNISFAWPYFAVLFLFIIFWFIKRSNKNNDQIYSYLAIVVKNIKTTNLATKSNNLYLICIWILLVLSLMRPQLIGLKLTIPQEGKNLMLAIDISESMKIKDMKINNDILDRLEMVKKVVAEFINNRKNDFIGLILFGSEAFLHAPLSIDHKTILTFLSEAQIGFLGPKTAIGEALLLGVKKLSQQNSGDKTIILLTDGQNNAGIIEPLEAAKIAVEQNVKIYIIGVGSKEMLVNSFFGTAQVNPSQDLENNEELLIEIAHMTKGEYFRSTDAYSLEKIYKKINHLEPSIKDNIPIILKKELFYWPLSIALIIFFIRAYFWSRRK